MHFSPETEAAINAERKQRELDKVIVGDNYSTVNVEREIAAAEELDRTINLVCEVCEVNHLEALRRTIRAEEMDPNVEADVEKFLWQAGLSVEEINKRRTELRINSEK